ncbi:uncharacterized protein MYCFIDRAFT_80868 [Pseudocercospora fijiensis CIRAD86]|uniref:Integral membrane protein n=1 Tax=Pseudocercospora fijiensis (strain CIRAD86) TaxID=383855 RepID=M3AMU3_PSEFD|nr:uncharacterized protein MYCFIDRAFT_80868 [Pseudocercospora fijiensis CIRAD86]EME78453.1 hypothetical protein MYCFIDRAFT_80868 [Pseudocercospora fijiensis CIRAD86]
MVVLTRAIVSDSNPVKQKFQLPGEISSLVVALLSLPIIAVFFFDRLRSSKKRGTTIASVTLLLTYITSFLFIFILTVVIHIRADNSLGLCDATIITCLTLYVLCKSAGFLFLIERAYIISWPTSPRCKTPEYVLSSVSIIVPYAVVAGIAMKNRLAYRTEGQVCIIGLKMFALLALTLVEVLAYLYLTLRFLVPLLMLHFGSEGLLLPLKRLVTRTCIGTAIAMVSVLTVKVSLTMFDGEPAWLCCLTCKVDALIGCSVLHWITKPDRTEEGEHGTPQALGIAFGNESGTTARQQAYGSHSPGSTPPKPKSPCTTEAIA